MGLSSFKLVQWATKAASFLRQSAFWPFKVIQGYPRSMILVPIESALCDFLLVINSNHGPILHRFRDTATYWLKIANFSYLSLIRRPRSLFPFEFRGKVNHEETRVMGLSCSEHPMIVDGVVLTQCQRVTDRQTDRQTDGRIYDS